MAASKSPPEDGILAENELSAVEDAELVHRSQEGDTGAFNELVTRYRGRIYAMIYHMTRNEQDAWDLAQDAFVRAWKSIHRFRGQSSFYTWLYRIVTNTTIDALRKKGGHAETEFDDSMAGLQGIDVRARTVPGGTPSPDENIRQSEIGARISAALEKLSPEHRAVIVLKEIEGLQYHEIADAVGCEIGTVMSRLFYARKKMQALLKDLYENI
ncbi:MAG TPA: sigma-70 family RNA polymerase sigma factor [Chthoniobacterales bacterium]